MTIKARVIAHSSHPQPGSPDLITLELYNPQIVHADFMTHRMFSRNAASFRAKPGRRLRAEIFDDLAEPVSYGTAKAGMQAGPPTWWQTLIGKALWRLAAFCALVISAAMDRVGLAKEVYNRIVMPYAHMSVVCTGTEHAWANFLHLRNHPDADPTIQALAEAVRQAIQASTPTPVPYGGWHSPYHADDVQRSVAACARVSYKSFANAGTPSTREEDLKLYARLVGGNPKHASPAEHQATPNVDPNERTNHGNLGPYWHQHRHDLQGESFFDLVATLDPEYRSRK